MERRRPGPPPIHQERDAAIVAAAAVGETYASIAKRLGLSETRIRKIVARGAAQQEQESQSGYAEGYAAGYAAVWRELADTSRHRRRDCECQVCGRYRSAVGM